ncbi:MAG: hypothetical protein F6K19_05070 [Cyanothece sp. SIO1E1]|nr:hypothetical protein [Cyanothece sp. SIO1E1]
MLSRQWSTVRFTRAREVAGAWVLMGVPQVLLERLCARLFVLGCSFVSCGCSVSHKSAWVVFKCPAGLSGRLALLFPAPAGFSPLLVSSSGRVLSGSAEVWARQSGCARASVQLQVFPGQVELPLAG